MRPPATLTVAALAAVALTGTGCGGGTAAGPTTAERDAPTATAASHSEEADHGHAALGDATLLEPVPLGTTVSLAAPGFELEAKAVEVVDPAPGTRQFTPQRDNRFVAIRVALRNVGAGSYVDTPSSGAAVVTSNGEEHGAAIAPAALEPLGRVELGSRESSEGFLTFEVPKEAELVELRLTPLSGFGPRAAVWSLRPSR